MEDCNNSYLSFKVGNDYFAVHTSKVNEIRDYEIPRMVPSELSFMRGLIDHRDAVVPVIDTGVKIGIQPVLINQQTCIIIIEVERDGDAVPFRVAILADEVSDVFDATKDDFKNIDADYRPRYIIATYKRDDIFYLLMDTDQVFSKNEVLQLSDLLEKIKEG